MTLIRAIIIIIINTHSAQTASIYQSGALYRKKNKKNKKNREKGKDSTTAITS